MSLTSDWTVSVDTVDSAVVRSIADSLNTVTEYHWHRAEDKSELYLNDATWYSMPTDMTVLSQLYTTVVFTVRGYGPAGAVWVHCYSGGKGGIVV